MKHHINTAVDTLIPACIGPRHILYHAPPTIPFHTVSCYTDDDCTGIHDMT